MGENLMDNTTNIDVVLKKKIDEYGTNFKDFVASHEITVTITIAEYRDLVSKCATRQKDIDDANRDKYTRESENKALKEENARLKAELYELKKSTDATASDRTKE